MQYGSYQGHFASYPSPMNIPPPPQMLPSPRYNVQGLRQQQSHSQQISAPSDVHRRVNSLPSFVTLPGVSPAGNPLIPILPEAEGRHGASPNMQGHGKHNFNAAGHQGHRRTHSGNALPSAVGPNVHRRTYSGNSPFTYGSTDDGVPARQQTSGKFSPRQEIMKLSKGYASRSAQQLQPPMSPGNAFNRGGMSPRVSPRSSAMRQQGYPQENLHVSFSPGTPIHEGGHAMASLRDIQMWDGQESPGSPYLGEATFQANRRNKARKMHMRQQSAQLFMEPVKGIKQVQACRDVMFVILFLFHLIGMAFLGITYRHDVYIGEKSVEDGSSTGGAGMEDATVAEILVDLEDDAVSISYRNVMYVTCLCGIFSVVISTLALVIMTVIAKRLVQVALILTISLSFAWGTIGIGVSPQNFVPITGIIALMLSVGYTFIVWDRIPFAAANLHAGLSGVRANAGTVVVAFAFQGLSLLWTIYFAHVLVGIYNALDKGDLVLSKHMTIFVYTMLGISYYWTYHVLMVSTKGDDGLHQIQVLTTSFLCRISERCSGNGGWHSWELVVYARW
jgi:hypothetical protein